MRKIVTLVVVASLSALAMPMQADAKGCIRGAVAGAVAGHYAHHHAVLGAMGGCVAGHEYYKHKAKVAAQQKAQAAQQAQPAH